MSAGVRSQRAVPVRRRTRIAGLVAIAMVLSASSAFGSDTSEHWDAAFADGTRIVLADAARGAAKPVVHPLMKDVWSARLSPDGRRVVFTAIPGPGQFAALYLLELASGEVRQIGAESGWHRDPAWTPDGLRVIFALHSRSAFADRRKNDDPATLYEYDIAAGTLRRLRQEGYCHHFPDVSPDGRYVLYTATDCRVTWNISRLDLRTGRTLLLTPGVVRDHQPAVSPDGKRFAFARVEGSTTEIRIAPIRGGSGDVVGVIHDDVTPQVRWSRDGRRLLWVHAGRLYTLVASDGKTRSAREPSMFALAQ